ncbi:nitroreductase family protein [Ideonella sp.]|uniref:nitroreductase family protein n=1 Tax=Ideonella sp. TaxID=1929293 RepID=UPI003BB67A5E
MTSPRITEHPVNALFTDRWSPRAFTGEAMPDSVLMSLLEAARWAPSASNIQPWRFVYAHAGTPAWQPIFEGLVPFNQGWASKASALIVVLSKKTSTPPGKTEAVANVWHSFDAGAAWASLAFQATLSGWAAHGMGGFDAAALRAALGVPDDVAIEAVVAVGKLGDKSQLPEALASREGPSARLPLAQIAAEGRYGFGA